MTAHPPAATTGAAPPRVAAPIGTAGTARREALAAEMTAHPPAATTMQPPAAKTAAGPPRAKDLTRSAPTTRRAPTATRTSSGPPGSTSRALPPAKRTSATAQRARDAASEVAIPGGLPRAEASKEIAAGVLRMAETLAEEPRAFAIGTRATAMIVRAREFRRPSSNPLCDGPRMAPISLHALLRFTS